MSEREFTPASIAAAGGAWVGLLVSANAMISATNPVFMQPLMAAFHAKRTDISLALAVAPIVVALAVPLAGRAMDAFGLRRVLIPGAILFGFMFLALSQVTSIWQLALMQVPLSIASSMHSAVGYAKLVSQWFDRWRGLVLGLIVALGAGVGQATMPQVARWLVDTYGWQRGYQGIGLIILVIGVPLLWLLIREPARAGGAARSVASAAEVTGLRWQEAVRTRTFWLLATGIMCGSMAMLGTIQHVVALLTEHGFTRVTATSALSFLFIGMVTGQLTSGLVVNQFNSPKVIVPYFLAGLAGLLLVHSLHASAGSSWLFGATLLMGLGLGGEVAQNAFLCSRYFGLRSFGAIYGLTFAASNLGIAIGFFTAGRLHDLAGSYEPVRAVFGVVMGVSVLCIALLGPFVYARKR